MCRYALRFGQTYEYFTEEHFQILQIPGKFSFHLKDYWQIEFQGAIIPGQNYLQPDFLTVICTRTLVVTLICSDKSKIEWVEANDFLTKDFDVSQIVTAADSDTMDANEDDTEEIQYAGDLANWRISGACRIVKKV